MGDEDAIVRASGQVDDEWQQNLSYKVRDHDDVPVHSRKDSWPAGAYGVPNREAGLGVPTRPRLAPMES